MLNINFKPFPVLSSERLILRRITAADADEMFLYRSDKELMRYIPHRLAKAKNDIIASLEMIDKGINAEESINWAVTLKGDNTIIGTVGFVKFFKNHYRAEVGYMLHNPYHRKGITTEATRCVIDYGFEVMKLHTIEAIVNHENTPSKKVLENLGFTNDAYFRDYLYIGDKFVDANVYSLVAKEK